MIIADDEALARYAFKTLISKNFNNISVVGEAESGREVIELCREIIPDIIIMDIKMPGINGLDASAQILEEFPNVSILILTAYENFNYIKQALDIGIKGYLLKPPKKEDVIEKIQNELEEIENRKKTKVLMDDIEGKINLVSPYIERKLVSAFMVGTFDGNEIKNYLKFLQKDILAGCFMVILLSSNTSSITDEHMKNKELRDKVQDIAISYISRRKTCMIGNPVGNYVVVFFYTNNLDNTNLSIEEIVGIGKEIQKKIHSFAGLDVGIGIGGIYHDMRSFKISYDQAIAAAKKASINNSVVYYSELDIRGKQYNKFRYPIDIEDYLLEQIYIEDIRGARESATIILEHFFTNRGDLVGIKDYFSQLITIIKRALYLKGKLNSQLENSIDLLQLYQLEDFEELQLWCRKAIFTLLDQLENKDSDRKDEIIMKALEYIDKEAYSDITLYSVAHSVGISAQYFSQIFKDEMGINFIDYLTKKRIGYAKKLLKQGNLTIKEIGDKVGYSDSNYFCRIFKKNTGMTPTKYRARYCRGIVYEDEESAFK